MIAYYNEFEPYAAQWLKNLIDAGHIPPGDVDTRSILEVKADELKGYTQCHFFAGIGGWAYAARIAGWPDDRPLWTGSCPCQPFSSAGNRKGTADERHLWPSWFELIKSCTPPVVMGEQVAAAVKLGWLDGVFADMEGQGYSCEAVVLPACAINAPHKRDRLWFVADTGHGGGRNLGITEGRQDQEGERPANTGSACGSGGGLMGNPKLKGPQGHSGNGKDGDQSGRVCQEQERPVRTSGFWDSGRFIACPDGKARRIEPGIRLVAHGIPARVGKLRAFGNAIVPQVAAEVITSYLSGK